MSVGDEYLITIHRQSGGAYAVIEAGGHGGYFLLHDLLTEVMRRAAAAGWLVEQPELPDVSA